MMQYLLTGLAGVALGLVAMRIYLAWQSEGAAGSGEGAVAGGNADAGAAAPVAAPAASGKTSPLSTRNLLIGAGALGAIAVAVLVLRSPEDPAGGADAAGLSAGPGNAAPGGKALDDVDTMIGRLAKRLESSPDDGEGFRMLGWSYVMTGQPEKAIAPYKRAMALLPRNATVHSGYGEALVGAARNTVTAEAKGHFEEALAIDPKEPRARYFMALWMAQNGQEREALDRWITLANDGPAEAPWQGDLHNRIAETAKKLGVDVSARLKTPPPAGGAMPPPIAPAAMQAAGALPAGQRQAMVDGMVEGLAAKLKANPANADGWAMLLRSRMVLKQADKAGQDLAAARAALAADAAGLAKVNAAARELKVPGA